MEVWEIVEFVRKQKGITIAELCGEEASRSVYKRFIQNKADTTVSKLTYFLKKLNLDYDELQLFNFPNDLSEVNRLMQEAVVAFEKKDSLELHSIIMLYETEEPDSQRERHLISLCRLMIAQLKEEKSMCYLQRFISI
ncbi:helix-turn-helix domain-containing protein [Enterococcus sp. DIV0996a]|uniref:helix-turn-helix domain-containing protein n=1 Tax=unclassified Enterococcus TaxID=2608891 RepID=UPI003F220151